MIPARRTWLSPSSNTFGMNEKSAFVNTPIHRGLYPQDASSMAALFGFVFSGSDEARSILTQLVENWAPIGLIAGAAEEHLSFYLKHRD